MVEQDFNTTAGFALYGSERKTRLLLPFATVAELEIQAEQKFVAEKAKTTPVILPKKIVESRPLDGALLMNNDFDLASIRLDTKYDLADAMILASRLLAKTTAVLDRLSSQRSNDLLIAIALELAYERKGGNLVDVIDYLCDPRWDSARQLLFSFNHSNQAFQQEEAGQWLNGFLEKTKGITAAQADVLIKHCHRHWTSVGQEVGKSVKCRGKGKARGNIQVFSQDALEKSAVSVGELKEERRAAGERILQSAHANNGNRTMPDAKAANVKLEAAKSRFENLVEPIGRLQMDLILSASMKPQEFRISPLLLLGEPGIGKTFLATQLAAALGVPTEKISAGGVQSGFQLTGSHSSWQSARPGLLFSLLAEGGSATPVVVIDEVDKIRDSTFPVLPVLLDVLDAGTSKHFKDEYFEMEFDASRIIFVMTANSIEGVPPALLSRVEVFDIPPPEPVQRLRIIREMAANLRLMTRRRSVLLDVSTSESLSERIDIDLRRVTRLVNEAFARAMQAGDTVARIAIPKPAGKRSIGFH